MIARCRTLAARPARYVRRTCAVAAGLGACLVAGLAGGVRADATFHPAPQGGGAQMVIYSTLDGRLAAALIDAFQAVRPDVAVRYEDLLADDIAERVVRETKAGAPTADFIFSSAMDLQLKLANDGYAQPSPVPAADGWPAWASWQDTAFALTVEPAVLVYHAPMFPEGPPLSRLDLMDWLATVPPGTAATVGTYDIEESAVGYLVLSRDADHFPDIWSVLDAMGQAGLQTFSTSQDVIDRVGDGRLALGYNVLGSYAADQARLNPDLGVVMLRDYTVVLSRVAMVPRAAAAPDLGQAFLAFLMSVEGQTLLSRTLGLPPVNPAARGDGTGLDMGGDQLHPVPVSPGVLVYLDQAKRARFLRLWRQALGRD